MTKPTLAEIRYYQVHGEYPESLKKRIKQEKKAAKAAKAAKASEDQETEDQETEDQETEDQDDAETFPIKRGGGWFETSDGKKYQDEDKALAEQQKLDLM